MPQLSIHYAAARICMLRRDAMDKSRLARLQSAGSLEEAKRALGEIGWSANDSDDWERLAESRVQSAAETVMELTTDSQVTQAFLLKYDATNLKTLIKARCLGLGPQRLNSCGTLPLDKLEHMCAAHSWKDLPLKHFREAMETIEQQLLTKVDLLQIDLLIDRALYREIFQRMNSRGGKQVKRYFQAKVDAVNAVSLLRARRMQRDAAFYGKVLLEGGTIASEAWLGAYDQPERLPVLLAAYGDTVRTAAADALADFSRLPALECAMDNRMLKLLCTGPQEVFSEPYVLSYLLSAEREASAVRLIMAGKANDFPQEAIEERLRELYV